MEPRTSQRLFGRVSVFNTVEARDESHGIIRHIPEQFVGGLVFPMMDALMASPFLPTLFWLLIGERHFVSCQGLQSVQVHNTSIKRLTSIRLRKPMLRMRSQQMK